MRILLLIICVLGLSATYAKAEMSNDLQFDSANQSEVRDDLVGLSSADEITSDLSLLSRRGRPIHHGRRVACFARNARGVIFRAVAVGYPVRFVQRAAVRYCRRHSLFPRSCRPLGCRF